VKHTPHYTKLQHTLNDKYLKTSIEKDKTGIIFNS